MLPVCARGYGDVPVLRGIDLSIPAGSITALIGANGAGKTTLLRAISGIIPAEAGTIRYDGHDVVGTPPQDIVRAGLVQVPEGWRLFPDMTVHENLLVGSSSPGRVQSAMKTSPPSLNCFRKCGSAEPSLPARCQAASNRWLRSRVR